MRSKEGCTSIKWSDISAYRGELFGVAIISVVLYHYFVIFNDAEAPNEIICLMAKFYNSAVGSVGVDVFVILSGFGLYYSLSRRVHLSEFYRKRFERVVLPYLICGLPFWIITDFFIRNETLWTFLYHYSLLAFWGSGVSTFWYITFISLMYIISPAVYRMAGSGKRLVVGIVCAFCLIPVCYFVVPGFFRNTEIALQRVPYFLVGMGFGKLSKDTGGDRAIPLWVTCLIACALPVKIIVGKTDFALARSFYGYYGIFLIFAYLMIRRVFPEKWGAIFRMFTICGAFSLEIYIIHTAVRNIMSRMGFHLQNPLVYLMHVVLVVPFVLCLTRITKSRMPDRIHA